MINLLNKRKAFDKEFNKLEKEFLELDKQTQESINETSIKLKKMEEDFEKKKAFIRRKLR